jgi:hypothetical protein
MAALAGYPGLVVVGGMYAGLWLLGRAWLDARPNVDGSRSRLKAIGFACCAVATFAGIGLAVLSPTYFGFLNELHGYAERATALSREEVLGNNPLEPAALLALTSPLPALLNFHSPRPLWTANLSMVTLYLCPILSCMGLAGLAGGCDRRWRWFVALLGLLCLACAMSTVLPLRGWLYDFLPPTRFFRYSGLFRCHALFSLVVLALLGSCDLERQIAGAWRRFRSTSAILAVAAVGGFGVVLWLLRDASDGWPVRATALTHVSIAWGGTLLLAVRGHRLLAMRPASAAISGLVALCVVDATLTAVLSKPLMFGNRQELMRKITPVAGSSSLALQDWDRQPEATPSSLIPSNTNLFTGTPVLFSYSSLQNRFHDALRTSAMLAASALGTQRMWFSRCAATCALSQDAFDAFARRTEELGRPCLVLAKESAAVDGSDIALESLPAAEPVAATIRQYRPNTLCFDVECPDDGWLLITDRWASGWRATVDGLPQEVLVGNFMFRALELRRGRHQVCFEYRPLGHPWFVLLSWGTLTCVFAVPATGRGARRVSRFFCPERDPA